MKASRTLTKTDQGVNQQEAVQVELILHSLSVQKKRRAPDEPEKVK